AESFEAAIVVDEVALSAAPQPSAPRARIITSRFIARRDARGPGAHSRRVRSDQDGRTAEDDLHGRRIAAQDAIADRALDDERLIRSVGVVPGVRAAVAAPPQDGALLAVEGHADVHERRIEHRRVGAARHLEDAAVDQAARDLAERLLEVRLEARLRRVVVAAVRRSRALLAVAATLAEQ